ncbi:unnamed protein product [Pedinophyceae sp. YPF-701]|nr:unnamed protein product [Pedinophyceae sp. YPF-701]
MLSRGAGRLVARPGAALRRRPRARSMVVDGENWASKRETTPWAERNKGPILEVLRGLFGKASDANGCVLELACGTGQHGAYFARELPHATFFPTDVTGERFESVAAWAETTPNMRPPQLLDASAAPALWPRAPAPRSGFEGVLVINMTHIAPWEATVGLANGAGTVLSPGGFVAMYGPFKVDGACTTASNAEFDRNLRARNPAWGYRDVADVRAAMESAGLYLERGPIEMPANNFMLVFRRRQAGSTERVIAMAASGAPVVDSAVHLWAPKEQSDKYPYAGSLIGSSAKANEPPMPGHADLLIQEMDAAGVDKALVVQPGNHLYDHSYVTDMLRAHPDRFVGSLLADPTPGGGGAAEVKRLVQEEGYRAVRFNPYLWPEGEKMDNEVGRAMYRAAGELGVPVGHMPFKGLTGHMPEIEALIADCPDTRVIIDHFGFCPCGDPSSQEWRSLLSLAKRPAVHVKLSAFFRVSAQDFPYMDTRPMIRLILDSFGPDKCLFGTDWPWVSEKCGYQKAWQVIAAGDEIEGQPLLRRGEWEAITQNTPKKLFGL